MNGRGKAMEEGIGREEEGAMGRGVRREKKGRIGKGKGEGHGKG